MGTFVTEAGPEDSEENRFMEIKAGTTEGELSPGSRPMGAQLDGNSPNENQDPLKNLGYNPGEQCDRSPGSQNHENGDGDLPSFSIKRLRRLPHRVATSDQQPSALESRTGPTGIAADRNGLDSGREGKLVAGASVTDLYDPAGDAAHSSGDVSVGLPQQVQRFPDRSSSKDGGLVTLKSPLSIPEEGTNPPITSSEVQSKEEIGGRGTELENGKLETELSGESGDADQSQAGIASGHELSEENKDGFAVSEHASDSANALEGEGERWRSAFDSHVPSSNPDVQHNTAIELQDDNLGQENVAPGTSDLPSSSAGIGSVSGKESIEVVSPVTLAEGPHQEGDASENLDMAAPAAPSEPAAEVSSPGIVQILPPVMGSRFESPEETTDEETDSPRSSEGFAYPDSDAVTIPYSGQVIYPARYSYSQSSNGPSLLQYSGSMSLRSDSSTTSNRSFAFPILAPPEWNSSPVRMAKPDPRYLRRRRRWDGCCFFRLGRSRYKY